MQSELSKIKQALDADEVRELHRLRAENARLLGKCDERRTIACLNACEGISTEDIEGTNIWQDWVSEKSENARLRAENARLLDALKQVLAVANVRIDDPRISVFDAARSAIAKAEK